MAMAMAECSNVPTSMSYGLRQVYEVIASG